MHPYNLLQRACDDELQPAEQAQLDSHLLNCPSCRAALAAQYRVERSLRHNERLTPSPDFTQRIHKQIAHMGTPRRKSSWQPLGLTTLGLGLLLLLVSWQEFVLLATNVATTSEALTLWLVTMTDGTMDVETMPAWLAAQSHLGLVVGLCLLGAASALVLRHHTEAA